MDERLFPELYFALFNQGTTTYSWPAMTAGNFYWWRVWAEDSAGLTSSTSTALMSGGPAVLAYKTMFDPRAMHPDTNLATGLTYAVLSGAILITTVIRI